MKGATDAGLAFELFGFEIHCSIALFDPADAVGDARLVQHDFGQGRLACPPVRNQRKIPKFLYHLTHLNSSLHPDC